MGIVLSLLMALSFSALAQGEIFVRGSEKSKYSRLVFELGAKESYRLVHNEEGSITLHFEQGAGLNDAGLAGQKLENIYALDVISYSPLELSLSIVKGSKVRDFRAGNRLIIDVYTPPGDVKKGVKEERKALAQAKPQALKSASAPSSSHKSAPPPSQEALRDPADDSVVSKISYEKEDGFNVAAPVEKVEHANKNTKKHFDHSLLEVTSLEAASTDESRHILPQKKEEKKPLTPIAKAQKRVRTNLITLSSIKASGLAAFEHDGMIWMVNDQEDLMLTPQVSGPDTDYFLPVEALDVESGKLFKVKAMEGATTRGQGGGLLWRLVISKQGRKDGAVALIRKTEKTKDGRGGKIIWPFDELREIIDVKDPVTGRVIKVVTVGNAKQYAGSPHNFVDFYTLESSVGLALVPKVDDLELEITEEGLSVSRPGGLAVMSDKNIRAILAQKERRKGKEEHDQSQRIYDFKNWQKGGIEALNQNKNILLSSISEAGEDNAKKIEYILELSRMYLSNALWAEALGVLNLAEQEMQEIASHPKFLSLRGAASALGLQSVEAFRDLSIESLDPFEEVGYWRAFALADLGDWQQADELLPKNTDILWDYPKEISVRLSLVLAEISLRAGNLAHAEEILEVVENYEENLLLPQESALNYLRGEAARQHGDLEKTKEIWLALIEGNDDLYRAKAGLAMTRLRSLEKEITLDKAIDNYERLRYSWRGDYLEAQINYWLGKSYFEKSDFVKGLNIMRDAASFSVGTALGQRITSEMTEAFSTLFLTEKLDEISPLDAAALYEQFSELMPPGDKGNQMIERLAGHLVLADLLGRASDLLSHQVEHRLQGEDARRVAVRLAVIYLLDGKPQEAMKALNIAERHLKTLPKSKQLPKYTMEIALLHARALSKADKPDQALKLLESLEHSPDINRLRVDIAWHAGYWDDAGDALNDVILDKNISLTRPLDDENTTLLLHRAVALNLASDRIALANMREKYSDAMAQTDKARIFEVITRPRQSVALADRETLLSIVSEVDLFTDFLKSYLKTENPTN